MASWQRATSLLYTPRVWFTASLLSWVALALAWLQLLWVLLLSLLLLLTLRLRFQNPPPKLLCKVADVLIVGVAQKHLRNSRSSRGFTS